MKNSKLNYLVVGGFVIASLILLVVSVALLTGRTGATDDYYAVYGNVSGLKYGTQVRYEGYPIGQVERISPFQEDGKMQFRVDMTIIEDWQIPKDSIAHIAAPGLLAAITISIEAGISDDALKSGDRINGREQADMFSAISSVAGQVGDLSEGSLKPFLANLNKTVVSVNKALDGDGVTMISDLRNVTDALSQRAPQILTDLEGAMGQANKLLSVGNRQKIEKVLTHLQEVGRNLELLTANLDETRAKADTLIKSSTNLVFDNSADLNKAVVDFQYVMESMARRVDSITQDLESTSRNLSEFSRHIRQNPGLLLSGTPPKDEAD